MHERQARGVQELALEAEQPARPYSGSPATGWPIASRWARIWCVRPVSSRTRRSVKSRERRARPRSASRPRAARRCRSRSGCGTRRSRPSGASIVPARAAGRPSTSARYSRVIRALLQHRLERLVGLLAACHHEQPGRVAVEAVHDPGAVRLVAADRAARQRLDERPARVPARRMHDHARRLVDDQQVLVLVGDVETRRPASRPLGRRRSGPDGDRARRRVTAWRLASGAPSTRTRPASISRCAAAREPAVAARKTSSRSPAASGPDHQLAVTCLHDAAGPPARRAASVPRT